MAAKAPSAQPKPKPSGASKNLSKITEQNSTVSQSEATEVIKMIDTTGGASANEPATTTNLESARRSLQTEESMVGETPRTKSSEGGSGMMIAAITLAAAAAGGLAFYMSRKAKK